MKKSFKGLVVCSLLSTAFISMSALANDDCDCTEARSSSDIYNVECEYSSIPQPDREECVPVYTSEEKCIDQPDITTFVPKLIRTETVKEKCQPPIIERIPHKKTREVLIPQPNRLVRVPVISYKEISVPQAPKVAYEDYLEIEEKVTQRPPLQVVDVNEQWIFEPSTDSQPSQSVTLNHHQVEKMTTKEPAMAICTPAVEVTAPAGCEEEAAACERTCESACPSDCALIRNDTEITQTFSFYYFESRLSLMRSSMKVTLDAGQSKTIKCGSWHAKRIKAFNNSLRFQTGKEILLSSLIRSRA